MQPGNGKHHWCISDCSGGARVTTFQTAKRERQTARIECSWHCRARASPAGKAAHLLRASSAGARAGSVFFVCQPVINAGVPLRIASGLETLPVRPALLQPDKPTIAAANPQCGVRLTTLNPILIALVRQSWFVSWIFKRSPSLSPRALYPQEAGSKSSTPVCWPSICRFSRLKTHGQV